MKTLTAVLLLLFLSFENICVVYGYAPLDQRIFSDEIQNIYSGIGEGTEMVENLNFTDIPQGFWAKEAITRSGALNMVKGFEKQYNPDTFVTNQEAISFVIRAMGYEQQAQDRAVLLKGRPPTNTSLETNWDIGHLDLARELGLVTQGQFNDALVTDPTNLNPATNFIRNAPATRENVAHWLVIGLQTLAPTVFDTQQTQQSIYNYSDWKELSAENVKSMESALKNGIFKGTNGKLDPKGHLTKAEMAQILKNMDNIYYGIAGIVKKTGTVGGIKDAQETTTNAGYISRDFYVRNQDGTVDVIKYQKSVSSSPWSGFLDAVVLKDGNVMGLSSLKEGDEIEYLVRLATNELVYTQVLTSEVLTKTVSGKLNDIDIVNGKVTIKDENDKIYTYSMNQDLYGSKILENTEATYYAVIDGKKVIGKNVPMGSRINLVLKNNVVSSMSYVGEEKLIEEQRGIVIENNPQMGYLTYFDNNGNQVVSSYYENDIKVEKQQYYNKDDKNGYMNNVFPNFSYDPKDISISDIEPGDILFMRFAPYDDDIIISASASPNYGVKHGKIFKFTKNGEYSTILFEYENKQTSLFNIPNSIRISKDGKPITIEEIKTGDQSKILINRAIIAPGNVIESVKEMAIEGDEHYIKTIVKGQLTNLDQTQNQLNIKNVQTLGQNGWNNYKDAVQYSIADKDIEYYQDGKRISLDYAIKYLKYDDSEVYVALENNYSGEKVKKVTFRPGRDELLPADKVISSDGNGLFTMLSVNGPITTDSGTIVRRHDRLVNGEDVKINDYAAVSLNGENKAAVVDIFTAPHTSGIFIITGRIMKIDDGKSFNVKSIATLSNNEWSYAPIERVFTIDHDTLFLDSKGIVDEKSFVSYGATSYLNKVVNVVASGSHGDRVILGPSQEGEAATGNTSVVYPKEAVRGTLYEDFADGALKIKDVTFLDRKTGKWLVTSDKNPIATVSVGADAIVVKNDKVVSPLHLKKGNQIRIMTENLPEKIIASISINGRIIEVEK